MGCVCVRHSPCAGACARVLIMGAEAHPSVPLVFLDRISVSRYGQLWQAFVSIGLSFRRGNERNFPERDGAQSPGALASRASLNFPV